MLLHATRARARFIKSRGVKKVINPAQYARERVRRALERARLRADHGLAEVVVSRRVQGPRIRRYVPATEGAVFGVRRGLPALAVLAMPGAPRRCTPHSKVVQACHLSPKGRGVHVWNFEGPFQDSETALSIQ